MFRLVEPSSGDTLTNLTLLSYPFYMGPYIVSAIVCYWRRNVVMARQTEEICG
jgi:hypothetical protein